MNVLLTGYTGNLGPELARQLREHRIYALVRDHSSAPVMGHVTPVIGSLEDLPHSLAPEIEMIVHSAASTAFQAPLSELRKVNVAGTSALIEFARKCPMLQRFIYLSTTCVAGDLQGTIEEARISHPPRFVNDYERSKWEAEAVVLDSGLPAEIVRLSIVAGSEGNGSVRRIGALHQTLYWLYHGLVPMLPGTPNTRVDLISTEYAAGVVATVARDAARPGRIVHATMGDAAPRLSELLDHLIGLFTRSHCGWAQGSIARPDVVDASTFNLFEAAARQSGDVLFQRICSDAQSFLPSLLHVRTFASGLGTQVPRSDWRILAERVFTWLTTHEWGRKPLIDHAA